MKLSLISFVVLCFGLLTSVNAQQEYFEYGFKGGVNLSSISGDVPSGYDTRTSMNIGGYGMYKILPKLGIQAELLYSEQGYSNEFTELGTIPEEDIEYEEVVRMQYINLPVLVSYNIIENLWIEGGVQVGYLVNAELEQEEVKIDNLGSVESKTQTIDQTDNYESIDFALAGGLRYKLNRNFMIQARYTNSLNDIDKELEGDQYNSMFSFSVGFVF